MSFVIVSIGYAGYRWMTRGERRDTAGARGERGDAAAALATLAGGD
jgi:hypothetical protein